MISLLGVAELELRLVYSREQERSLELARLLREGRPARPTLRRRMLWRIGEALVGWGQALQRRHTGEHTVGSAYAADGCR